jgi:hypothetical protein
LRAASGAALSGRNPSRLLRDRASRSSFHTTSKHVTGSAALQGFRQSFATVQDARSLVLVDDLAPCPPQRVELQGKVLIVGRDAGITDRSSWQESPCPDFAHPFVLFQPFKIKSLQSCGRRDKRLQLIACVKQQ